MTPRPAAAGRDRRREKVTVNQIQNLLDADGENPGRQLVREARPGNPRGGHRGHVTRGPGGCPKLNGGWLGKWALGAMAGDLPPGLNGFTCRQGAEASR